MAIVSKKQARQANKAGAATPAASKKAIGGKIAKKAVKAPVQVAAESDEDDDDEGEWSDESDDEGDEEEDEDEDNGGVSQKGLQRLMALVGDDLDEIALAQLGMDGDEEDEEDDDEDHEDVEEDGEEMDDESEDDEDVEDDEDDEVSLSATERKKKHAVSVDLSYQHVSTSNLSNEVADMYRTKHSTIWCTLTKRTLKPLRSMTSALMPSWTKTPCPCAKSSSTTRYVV